jgi:hypothetical protein
MTAALYATIWIALVLFVAGERRGRPALLASALGWILTVVHVVVALGGVHGWSHDAAVAAAARQTAAVYGIAWGGGTFVNYVFLLVWAIDLARRSRAPDAPRAAPLVLRAFYFVFLMNAAVIFAVGWRRALGAALMLALLWMWRPRSASALQSPP